MPIQRQFKKGEFLFREGDKAGSLFLIQSGGVSQCLQREKKNIELYQLAANHFIGEACFLSQAVHLFSAVATSEVKVMEFTGDEIKSIAEAAGGVNRVLLKSLAERMKSVLNDVKSSRMDRNATPCPPDQVPKIFSSIYFTASHKGTKSKSGETEIDWSMFKTFSQRVFGESPLRMEQALNLLVKLKLVKLVLGPSPEDPAQEVLAQIVFYDLAPIEAFYELYQYFYFKPGKSEFLKYDDSLSRVLQGILKKAEGLALDRFGVVSLDYAQLTENLKNEFRINLTPDILTRLEQKGLLYKRKTVEGDKVKLEFDIREWKNMSFLWRILREIGRWNELGFVDVREDLEKPKVADGPQCGECGKSLASTQKFCSECGAKNSNFQEKAA